MAPEHERLMTAAAVRKACGGISDMTLHRWLKKEILSPPVVINGRRYWPERVIRELQKNGRVAGLAFECPN